MGTLLDALVSSIALKWLVIIVLNPGHFYAEPQWAGYASLKQAGIRSFYREN
jgi:hypothetical protein